MADSTLSAAAAVTTGKGQAQLTVVVPMYRAAAFIVRRMGLLVRSLETALGPGGYQLIVVDDGSDDGSAGVLLAARLPGTEVLPAPRNEGKWAAVQRGVAASRGRIVIVTDADLPYPTRSLLALYALLSTKGFDLAVGDRTLAQGGRGASRESRLRRLAGVLFAGLTRVLYSARFPDTQCGLKGFDGEVARMLVPELRERRFAGDLELLYAASKLNLATHRFPAAVEYHGESTVRVFSDGWALLIASLRIKGRALRGRPRFAALHRHLAQRWREQGFLEAQVDAEAEAEALPKPSRSVAYGERK